MPPSRHPTATRGIVLAFGSLLVLGVMPVISNGRPAGFDALDFAAFLSLWQLLCALPVAAIAWLRGSRGILDTAVPPATRRHTLVVIVATGLIFGLSTYVYVLAFEKAGTVSAALAIQAYPLFAMLWEGLFLKRRKSLGELAFTLLLVAALGYLATGGTWRVEGLSGWFLFALALPLLWSIAHVIVKETLGATPITPAQITFVRVLVSTILLVGIALASHGPAPLIDALMTPAFQTAAFAMGAVYYLELMLWFHAVRSIEVSLASSIVVPAPVVTTILAVAFLGESVLPYQFIGMTAVFIGLYGLLYVGGRRRASNRAPASRLTTHQQSIRKPMRPSMTETTYPITKENKIRVGKRAVYDRDTVHAIIDTALVCHVGFVVDGRPIVLPMIHARCGETIYLHGAKATRIVKALATGVPVCLEATHVDGIVVGRSAFHSSMNYRSAVVHGTARAVNDADEHARALEAITDRIIPGRWAELRPMLDKEVKGTGVISLEIEAASAKCRDGEPIDEEADYDTPVWGGVVPVQTVFGAPAGDSRLLPGVDIPASVRALTERATTEKTPAE